MTVKINPVPADREPFKNPIRKTIMSPKILFEPFFLEILFSP